MAGERIADDELVHNFLTEQKWAFLLSGFAAFKREDPKYLIYNLYRFLIMSNLVYIISMAFTAAVLCYDDIALSLQCAHIGFVVMEMFLNQATRLTPQFRRLHKTLEILQAGVFIYNEEILEEEYTQIKKKYIDEIRNTTWIFRKLLVSVSVSNVIIVPILNLYIIEVDASELIINPYLPSFPIYFPFDTTTYAGYVGAYIILVGTYLLIVVPILITMDTIYVSCTIQLKAQFHILNHSLSHLEKRAYSEFLRHKKSKKNECLSDNIYNSWEFLNSLRKCLRSNMKHHQILIELKKSFDEFTGLTLFLIISLTSLILAANVLVILEKPQLYVSANALVMLLSELYYVMHYCRYGEDIIEISSETYDILYSTPWYNCDSTIKKYLSIAISNTRKPIILKTILLDFSASMDAFGTIISTMYKVMNVITNT